MTVSQSDHSEPTGAVQRPYFFRYLSQRAIQKLPSYQYHGTDSSYLYQYVVSPGLNHAIDHDWVPRCIHPNLITLTALMFMVVSHCITYHFCPTFSEEAPGWVFVFNAFAMIVYWILDALDGKQARKLGLSSPLGLLCDHGCDALNTTVGLLNVAAMLSVGPTVKCFYLWFPPSAVFFAATWEEYYVGSLNLPLINGPNEGVILGAMFQLWTAFVGTHWWLEMTWGVQRNTILICVLASMSVVTLVTNTYNVSVAVAEMKKGEKKFTESQLAAGTRKIAATRAIPFFVMVAAAWLWAVYSPSDVVSRNPRLFLWVLGLVLCKQVMTMMVAHLCDDEYHPFGRTVAGTTALCVHMLLTNHYIGITADVYVKNLSRGGVIFFSKIECILWGFEV